MIWLEEYHINKYVKPYDARTDDLEARRRLRLMQKLLDKRRQKSYNTV